MKVGERQGETGEGGERVRVWKRGGGEEGEREAVGMRVWRRERERRGREGVGRERVHVV